MLSQGPIFINQKFSFVPGLFYEDILDYPNLSVKGIKKVDVEICWNDYLNRGDTVEVYEEITPLATVFFDKKGRQTMAIYEQVDTIVYGNYVGNQWSYRYVYGYSDSILYDFNKKGKPISCRYSLTDTLFKVDYDELGNRIAYNRGKTVRWIYEKGVMQNYIEQHENGDSKKIIYLLNDKDTSHIKAYYTGWIKMDNDCDSAYFFFTQDKKGRPLWTKEIYYNEESIQIVESHFSHSKYQSVCTVTNSENVRFNDKYVFEYGKRGELLECKYYNQENLISAERYTYTFY